MKMPRAWGPGPPAVSSSSYVDNACLWDRRARRCPPREGCWEWSAPSEGRQALGWSETECARPPAPSVGRGPGMD